MVTKFILGGGLSGLIYAFYHPDYTIISPNLGGKLVHNYLQATILLHDTLETRMLLEELGIRAEREAHFIRYFFRGHLLELENVPEQVHQMLIAKKLTPWDKLAQSDGDTPFPTNGQSSHRAFIPVYRIPATVLVEHLSKRVQWINDTVKIITATELVTQQRKRYPYTDLVSTLPAYVFWRLYQKERSFARLPVTFVLSNRSPVPEYLNGVWDLIYFVDSDIKYTRVNRNPETGDYLYEFTGVIRENELQELYPDLNIKRYNVDECGVIFTDENNIPPENVRFIGRFATWNSSYSTEDAIRDALVHDDFFSVWNNQKAFNANFFDFNVKDIELQQRLTKEFVLHLMDEAHELLHTINWKMARYMEMEVRREQLLEEWIDIFKYWLGIGNIWGFSIQDFFREYWRKSSGVEARFKSEDIKRIRESLIYGSKEK